MIYMVFYLISSYVFLVNIVEILICCMVLYFVFDGFVRVYMVSNSLDFKLLGLLYFFYLVFMFL